MKRELSNRAVNLFVATLLAAGIGIVLAMTPASSLAQVGVAVKNGFVPCNGTNCDNVLTLGGGIKADGSEITLTNVDLDTTDNSVAANVCERQANVTATGVVATDNLLWTMTSTDLAVTFDVGPIIPGAGVVTIQVCNNSAGAADPGAVADFRIWRVQ